MALFTFLESVFGLLLALIPLIGLIITIIRDIAVRFPLAFDGQLLKVDKIERKGQYSNRDILILLLINLVPAIVFSGVYGSIFAISLFDTSFTASFRSDFPYLVPIIRVIADLSTFIVISFYVIYISNFIARLLDFSSRKYYFFEDACVVVEAQEAYLYNKCYETLRSLRYKVVDVDEDMRCLTAFQIRFLQPPFGFSINKLTVTIEPYGDSAGKYQLSIGCYRFNSKKLLSSHIINRFIEGLLSRPKGDGNKDGH
jgi:hypothetical protein